MLYCVFVYQRCKMNFVGAFHFAVSFAQTVVVAAWVFIDALVADKELVPQKTNEKITLAGKGLSKCEHFDGNAQFH